MNMEEFKEVINQRIKEYLPDSYKNASIQFSKTLKNNDIELDTLVISSEHQQLIPNIYLKRHFDDLNNGVPVDEVLNTIAAMYMNGVADQSFDLIETEFTKMKENIIVRIVGKESNCKIKKIAPYRIEHDLLVTFRWMAKKDENGLGTALITNTMLERWRGESPIDLDELYEVALENTKRLFPPYVSSMEEMILGLINDMEEFNDFLPGHEDAIPMYVITNRDKLNGATVILYPGILEEMATKLNSDYFVLPSSIHEVIIVADDNKVNVEQLRSMVVEINRDMVESEEVLSNSVFRYDRATKQMKEIIFDMGL